MGVAFTHAHVRAIAMAVATYLEAHGLPRRVFLGCDPREGNDPHLSPTSYTKTIVDTLTHQGVSVMVADTFCPTPVVSWAIPHYGLGGGLILTASHNPKNYNGIKFNPANGAPSPTTVTDEIETLANRYLGHPLNDISPTGTTTFVAPFSDFSTHMAAILSRFFPHITYRSLTLAIDAKHGAVGDVWRQLALHIGVNVALVHDTPRADFGDSEPNPTVSSGLTALRALQTRYHAPIAIANDPDGDRHAILDDTGEWLSPELVCVIIADYFCDHGFGISSLASTVASSLLLRRFCDIRQIRFEETAVGFKYLSPILDAARSGHLMALAVESSGGFSASFHTLEKCGFLPGLLLMGIVQSTGHPLSVLKARIVSRYGHTLFTEKSYTLTAQHQAHLNAIMLEASPDIIGALFSRPVVDFDLQDGLKCWFSSDQWALLRLSGTEPLLRLYVETLNTGPQSERAHQGLLDAIDKNLFLSSPPVK